MSDTIGIVWSDLDHRLIQDAAGTLKKVDNVKAVMSSVDNILRTSKGERCFTGGTKIALLNGTNVSIEDLSISGGTFWVYTFNQTSGKIEPGVAKAFKTGRKKVIEITLDNDEVIRCTPEHKFMLRNGHYKKAVDLVSGDSLMPLYLNGTSDGYVEMYQPFSNTTERVHQVISVIDKNETEDVYDIYVEGTHNFALASGVFVHNCMLPSFGSSLKDMVFESMNSPLIDLVSQSIKEEIEYWDNRVRVTQIRYLEEPDNNSIIIEIAFAIKGYSQIFKTEVAIRGEAG